MRASVTFVALAVASVSAQANYNFTSELDMTIDPNTVKQSDRATWCRAQTNTCSLLCNNNAEVNGCTESTLKWNCTCASNSSTPGIEYYRQTVPYFICEALYGQCIQQGAGTIRGQDQCNDNIKPLCATIDQPKGPVDDGSSSETSGTASSTSKPTASASGSDAAVSTTSSKGLANPTMAPVGSGAFVAAMGLMAYML